MDRHALFKMINKLKKDERFEKWLLENGYGIRMTEDKANNHSYACFYSLRTNQYVEINEILIKYSSENGAKGNKEYTDKIVIYMFDEGIHEMYESEEWDIATDYLSFLVAALDEMIETCNNQVVILLALRLMAFFIEMDAYETNVPTIEKIKEESITILKQEGIEVEEKKGSMIGHKIFKIF